MELRCVVCRKPAPERACVCAACGGPLDLEGFVPVADPTAWSGRGVWRYANVLPVPAASAVSIGEGGTPLRAIESLGVTVKLESMNPTGSFKDRGATLVVSKAKQLGARVLVEDSSGNAGTSVAAFAARAGLKAHIVSPDSIVKAKADAITMLGATLERVGGPRSAVTRRAKELAQHGGAYWASHVMTPWFVHGTKTVAYEVREEAGAAAFDVVVTPVGNGTLLLGVARGFAEMVDASLESSLPRLVAVQPSGCSPLVDALDGKGPKAPHNALADGTQIPEPPRLAQMVEALQSSKGAGVRVDEAQTRRATVALAKVGVEVEPTSAMALAGLDALRAEGVLRGDDRVLMLVTGRAKG
jgi:threonine synthase